MRWPWVSRRWHEYEVNFWECHAEACHRTTDGCLKQMDEFLEMHAKQRREAERLRAQANTMKGILKGHGFAEHERFGPYFDANGPTNIS